jgi:guanidinopropionase
VVPRARPATTLGGRAGPAVSTDRARFQPLDSLVVPRYAEVATFMRLPRSDELDGLDIGVFGVPLDMATFRGGTREGPAAIREASRAIRRVNPSTLVSPFDRCNIADLGDAPVNVLDHAGSLVAIGEFVAQLDARGIAPAGVGGDHTATLAILRGMRRDRPFGVLQFDSHADIQDRFLGTKDNHASVMRRAHEEGIIDAARVVQLGLRGTRYGEEDVRYGTDAGFTLISYDDYESMGRSRAIELIRDTLGQRPCYVTFDLDGLDPSQAPGTPAREPGGLSMRDAQVILRSLSGLPVIGGDVCECAPMLDPSGLTATNAANLLFEIVCLIAAARAG